MCVCVCTHVYVCAYVYPCTLKCVCPRVHMRVQVPVCAVYAQEGDVYVDSCV